MWYKVSCSTNFFVHRDTWTFLNELTRLKPSDQRREVFYSYGTARTQHLPVMHLSTPLLAHGEDVPRRSQDCFSPHLTERISSHGLHHDELRHAT